jgi:hypothetical protein
MDLTPKLRKAFWSRVNKNGPTMPHMSTPCWIWRSRMCGGYGRLVVGRSQYPAHRMSLTIDGRDPGPLVACHRCDNPPCVNPEHLFAGTNGDNVRDMYAKIRAGIRPPLRRRPRSSTMSDLIAQDGWGT